MEQFKVLWILITVYLLLRYNLCVKLNNKDLLHYLIKMALSNKEIIDELKNGNIVISPYNENNLQINSYDVTLGEYFYRENEPKPSQYNIYSIWYKPDVERVWKLHKANDCYHGSNPEDKIIWIRPQERILSHTQEFIGGKNNITTEMKARSSLGRSFISVCLCAGLGDIGYTNRWTLEITNHSRYYTIPLIVGRRIAQIVFFRTGEPISSYNGKYNGGEKDWKPEDMLPKLYLDKEEVGVDSWSKEKVSWRSIYDDESLQDK